MPNLLTFLFGDKNRISRRLIVLIIAFSSVITLCISAVQLIGEYRQLRNGMERELDGISIHVPSIAGSVWDFDEKQIRLALHALTRLPGIEQAGILLPGDQKQWQAGQNQSHNIVIRTYSLRHDVRGTEREIGILKVSASLDAIYRQVVASALSILLSNALKTFLVVVFMAVLFRRLVTRRLEALVRKVNKLLPNMLHLSRAVETKPQSIPPHLDELDALDWTLNKTAENLGLAVMTLRGLNQELEDRVLEKEAILQNALVGIVVLHNWKILTCNRRFEELFGYGDGEMIGQPANALYPDDDAFANFCERSYAAMRHGANCSDTLKMVKRDGTPFWSEISGRALDSAKPQEASIWIYTDVTERKMAEEQIKFIAYHDTLTGLPNRLLLQDRLQQAMGFAERDHSKVALLFLDLDNFKTINDSLGHSIGDGLIQQAALRLSESMRSTDTISRHGGDEFLIVLPNLPDPDATATLLSKLMKRLLDPYEIEGHELTTSGSIGIAVYPDDGADFDTLMKKADMAMYRAKDAGRNTYRFFDEQMNVEAVEQLRMRNGLRRALERGEFVLHYQPQIDLASGALVGAEALIRWNHPTLGMIPPARFIPIAEDSGLIVPIGEWVLRTACHQAAAWRQAGIRNLTVAVNLSAIQFKHGDLEQSIIGALTASGIDPALLELELTESILIHNTESVLATVKRLKLLGVKLSIDDFGTGYSSLSYLKRFEVDKLKIDQSFVRDLTSDPEDAAIVRAIIQMAKNLGLRTIAEGVEDEKILHHLRAFECDEAQGYFFARPMPAEALSDWYGKLTERQAR